MDGWCRAGGEDVYKGEIHGHEDDTLDVTRIYKKTVWNYGTRDFLIGCFGFSGFFSTGVTLLVPCLIHETE